MNALVDAIGDRASHPLAGLLDAVTLFVREYEERHVAIPDATPGEVLRFLMDCHKLRRADLVHLFGSLSTVGAALNGRRNITAREAKGLGHRFSVSPAVFL